MAEQAETAERREVFYSGRVQGVGFRYTTLSIARRFAATGFVENLPDGRVHLVAEGEPSELDRFLAAVEAELGRHITDRQLKRSPCRDEFSTFGIRH
jgi:acylphosphatase